MTANAIVFLPGNHLYPATFLDAWRNAPIVMVEDARLCTRHVYHQQKLALMIAAMREHAASLREAGFDVRYFDLDAGASIDAALTEVADQVASDTLVTFPVTDHALQQRLASLCNTQHWTHHEIGEDPGFLTSKSAFAEYTGTRQRLRMADFYARQRTHLNLLLDPDGQPKGGKWSFDAENRKKLPRKQAVPSLPEVAHSQRTTDAMREISERFASHPGRAEALWLPTDRAGALAWLQRFISERLHGFGTYEDAITQRSATLFHSTLSPLLNLGLLTPREVLDAVMQAADDADIPLNDLEGFIRQLTGWREFVRGTYDQFADRMRRANRRAHNRHLTHHWHNATTGIAPLDDAIRHQLDYAWTHHINRLMILSNLMNLCEIEPGEVCDYFMRYYLDAYDWVMVPNVYGMGLTSDDGVFATKPYVCGSNYLLKMSDFAKGDWCDVVDGLYWRFVRNNQDEYKANPRLSLALGQLGRMAPERAERIFAAADNFLERCTTTG